MDYCSLREESLKGRLLRSKNSITSQTVNTTENTNNSKKKTTCKIKDYKVINSKVVIVTFTDGTTEKAVCSPEDKFDLERAIEICICKKVFGGTNAYNNAIKKALKEVSAIDEKKKKDKEEAELIEKRKEKAAKKKKLRQEKKRQEQVQIQAEAFLKAMQMYDEQVEAEENVDVDATSEN